VIINKKTISILSCTLLFSSCEKIPLATEILEKVSEQNKSVDPVPPASAPLVTLAPAPIQKDLPKEETKPTEVESIQPKKPAPPAPETPKFSKELLAAVQNWTRIPKSVFPAKPVIASIPVDLEVKTSSGQVMGSSLNPAGTELQVLGTKGNTLVVANLHNSKLRGEVDIDQTDFKQLLAYRFELNQRKKMEAQATRAEQAKLKTEGNIEKPQPTQDLDAIPDPLDFGHGRFCICRDCREKRLAKTGSLKTGFGLEP
jgi:hypothetical protein